MKEKYVNDFYLSLNRFLFFIFRFFRLFSFFNIYLTFVDVTINFRAFDAFFEHTFDLTRFLVSNAKIANFFDQFLFCSNLCFRCQMRFTFNQLVFFNLIIVNFIIIIINYIVYTALLCVVESFSFARLHQIRLNLIESLIFNEISKRINHIMSKWITWIDYSSLQWEWRRNRIIKWIFTTINEHDEWTK
jgi:hypothetical protein